MVYQNIMCFKKRQYVKWGQRFLVKWFTYVYLYYQSNCQWPIISLVQIKLCQHKQKQKTLTIFGKKNTHKNLPHVSNLHCEKQVLQCKFGCIFLPKLLWTRFFIASTSDLLWRQCNCKR